MSTTAMPREGHSRLGRAEVGVRHAAWFAAGLAVAFAAPWLGTSVLDLDRDLYYAAYFASALGFLALYARSTGLDGAAVLRRNWRWSLGIGAVVAVAVVANVLNDPATARPGGVHLAVELLWRGLVYGVTDALLLQAFPAAVAYSVLGGEVGGLRRRVGFAALTLPLVVIVTAVYHLGYEQFRDDGLRQPETGNAILSVPVLLTANPVGSVVAHATMHVAAVAHAYETPTYLPPQSSAG